MRRPRSLVWCFCLCLATWVVAPCPLSRRVQAAEHEFVGVLALAVEDETAEQLGLTKGQREKLEALIDAREQAAIGLVAEVRNLSPAERNARLAEFRRQSEAQGLPLLSRQQIARLQRIWLRREGLSTLADPAVAEQLQLKPQQRDRVREIIRQRAEKLARANPQTAHVVRAEIERELASVLDNSQRAAWEALAQGAGGRGGQSPQEGDGGWRGPRVDLVKAATPAPENSTPPDAKSEISSPDKPKTQPQAPETPDLAKTEAAKPETPTAEAGKPEAGKPEASRPAGESSGLVASQAGASPAGAGAAPSGGPATSGGGTALGASATASGTGSPPPKFPFPPPPGAGQQAVALPNSRAEGKHQASVATVAPSAEPPKASPGVPAEVKPGQPQSPEAKSQPVPAPVPVGDTAPRGPGPGMLPPTSAGPVVPPSPGPDKGSGLARPGFPFGPAAAAKTTTGNAQSAAAGGKPGGPGDKLGEPMREGKLRFNFRYAPWKDVLEWFAEQNQLSLVMESPPKGTFNYIDPQEYTPTQALDLINVVLQAKGYRLLRRDRMLWVINLEDKVPENLIETIAPEELDQRGDFEIVRVLFQLTRVSPEEAQQEIDKIKGPQGVIVVLPKARQVLVTDSVGKLRIMRRMIDAMENPGGLGSGPVATVELRRITAQEASTLLRQLMDIPADRNATTDGSLRFATDPEGKKVLLTGKPEAIARAKEILESLDAGKGGSRLESTPQLEVYTINSADSNAVLQVLQTLLSGEPDVRLAIDPKTGNLVAYARLAQHKTIRETLEQLQRDTRRVEVFQLHTLDPQVALAAVQKIFVDASSATAPKVEADGNTRQLIIRGSEAQILQIREMLKELGEDVEDATQVGGGRVRVLPYSGRAARTALEQIQQIWPQMRSNPIRQVFPSSSIPAVRPSSEGEMGAGGAARPGGPGLPSVEDWGPSRSRTPGFEGTPAKEPAYRPLQRPRPASSAPGPTAGVLRGAAVYFVSDAATPAKAVAGQGDGGWRASAVKPAVPSPAPPQTAPPPRSPAPGPSAGQAPAGGVPSVRIPQRSPSDKPAPIIVAPGPGGIMITSEDQEALAEFEQLLQSLAATASTSAPEITIFYLKHAKAAVVAETLDAIFGGGTGGGGGGSLLGDLAGAAIGGPGGNIVGALLGGGDSGTSLRPTGQIHITPDTRLNALIVQANPVDLDRIEELLKILDQRESPEDVLAAPKPRLIPVYNTQAQEVAEIVRQVYQDRMVAGPNTPQRPPSPQEFFQMIRGMAGRRGGAGGRRGTTEDTPKMSIGVDTRTNSLVVVAPDNLFQEIKALVEELDQAAAGESNEAMEVVTLQRTNSEAVRRALVAMMGESVRFGQGGTTPSSRTGQPSSSSDRFQGFGGFRRRTEGAPQPGFSGGFPGGFPGGFRGSRFSSPAGPSFQPFGSPFGAGGFGRSGFGRSGTGNRSSRSGGTTSGRPGR